MSWAINLVSVFAKKSKRLIGNESGVAAIEAAIIMPAMFALIFGGMQASFMVYDYILITNAAAEGARQGSLSSSAPLNSDGIGNVVQQFLTSSPPVNFGTGTLSTYLTTSVSTCVVNISGSTMTYPNTPDCSIVTAGGTACPATRLTPPAGTLLQVNVTYVFNAFWNKAATWSTKTIGTTAQYLCQ